MKKFLSLLLALSLLLSLSAVALAATEGQLTDGDNVIELPFDSREPSVYTYTATQTGTLYLCATEFYCASGDKEYFDNSEHMDEWEMYTELTVNGQLLDGKYSGAVEVVEGETYTISWTHGPDVIDKKWYNLGWRAVLNLSYTDEWVPKAGSETMPVELRTEQCPTDSIEVPAGGTVWYLLYDFGGAEFIVTGENAYVAMTAWNQETMQQENLYFEAVDGVVTVPVSSYYALLQIGNSGTENAVFGLRYQYPLGTEQNPDTLKLGENVATVEENNYDGYTYQWTAQCNGVLTLTLPESNWMAMLTNLTEGSNPQWFDSTGESVITLEVSAGDQILFNINYINEKTYAFPGGDVAFTVSVAYDHSYVDGKCQHCGAEELTVELGDVNGDGRFNARDARALLQYLAGLSSEDPVLAAADFNGDGRVNARDARAILQRLAGLA